MKFITDLINETKTAEYELSAAEIARYISKVGSKLPKEMQVALMYLQKYNILSQDDVLKIINATKPSLKPIASEFHMPAAELEDLQKVLKGIKGNDIRMLPMFLSEEEREDLEKGTKNLDDVTLDFDSEKGHNEIAKKYMPLVTAIANKFVGKSSLGRNELISAGMMGLTSAINSYRRPDSRIDADDKIADKEEAKKQKRLTFKQYAGWCIRNHILYDINYNSRVVRTSQYQYEKNKKAGEMSKNFEVSIDKNFGSDEDGVTALDRMAELATSDSHFRVDVDKQWDNIFKELEKKFNTRSMNMFYKFFGLHGMKKMKGQEIAKEFGVTSSCVSGIIKNIVSYLKDDPKMKNMLADLIDVYAESLLIDNLGKSQDEILEAFAGDDIYLLLEDATRWINPSVAKAALNNALTQFDKDSVRFINNCIDKGFDFLDAGFKRHRKLLVTFLEIMYPTESFSRKSDVYILDKMMEIVDALKK